MDSKNLLKSKTLWFNGLSIMAILVTDILASPEMKTLLGSYAPYMMVVGAFINAVLRQYTTVPLRTAKDAVS